MLKKLFLITTLALMSLFTFAQGVNCLTAEPFCSDDSYSFPMGTGTTSEAGPDYGCLITQPNPYWYYLQIAQSGPIDIYMESPTGNDIDFICWGPFADPSAPCTAQLTSGTTVDCSFSALPYETCNISNAVSGEFYIMLITNYSNASGDIVFNQTNYGAPGAGSTDCSIVNPCVITALTAVPGPCEIATNTYDMTGTVGYSNAPASGQLIITNSCTGSSLTFNPPFGVSTGYSFTDIPSTGTGCSITVIFTGETTCTATIPYMSPVPCSTCITNAGLDQTICGLTTTLNASELPTDINTHWDVIAGIGFSDINSPNPIITATVPGTYILTWNVTNSAGITCNDNVSITFNQIPTSTFTISPITCFGNTSTITYTGNASSSAIYGWTWANGSFAPGGTTQGPQIGSWTVAGNQSVTLTVTENGCTSTTTSNNTFIPSQVTSVIQSQTNVTCFGLCNGNVVLNNSGGISPYTYNWSNGVGAPFCAGNYTVVVSDMNGCSVTVPFTITEPTQLQITNPVVQNVTCFNGTTGSISITAIGGTLPYTYSWSNNLGLNSPINSNLQDGNYTVTVTDGNLCTATMPFVITEPTQLIVSQQSLTNVSCFNGNNGEIIVNVVGGTLGYTYSWSNNLTLNSNTNSNLISGPYSVTVRDGNNCTVVGNYTVTQPTQLVLSTPVIQQNPCFGNTLGSITVTTSGGTPGYVYNWSNIPGIDVTTDPNLPAGPYGLTVTDLNGCTITGNYVITQPTQLLITNNVVQNAACFGQPNGSIGITVGGGTPNYTYSWSNNLGLNSPLNNGIIAGNYSVTVTDVNLCSVVGYYTVTEPAQLIIDASASQTTICQGASVTLSTSVIGGQQSYQYYWNSVLSTSSIIVQPSSNTTYVAQVIDGNGCPSNIDAVNIIVTPGPVLNLSINDHEACIGDPFVINGSITGGIPPYTIYDMNNSVVSFPYTLYLNTSGTYVMSIEDGCGAVAIDTLNLTIKPLPVIDISSDVLSGCVPLVVNFNTATSNVASFFWVAGTEISYERNPEITFETSGIFDVSLTVVGTNGCKATATIVNMINVYPLPHASFYTNPNSASEIEPIIRFDNMSTGNLYNYWYFGDGDSSISVSPTHIYHGIGDYDITLVVENQYGCKDTAKGTIMIYEETTLYVPTAFSPDADGVNDIFLPQGHNIKENTYTMWIYDRWGEIIFVTNDITKGWDGRAKNNAIVQVGVYTWQIQYQTVNGIARNDTGPISVIR